VHFGLGQATKIDRVLVRWPDGTREVFGVPGIDRFVDIAKGHGTPHEP
jgi:hypothetical protein